MKHLAVLCLLALVAISVVADISSQEEEDTDRHRHRRRHRHRHHLSNEENDGEDSENAESEGIKNSLESRLQVLEEDVKYLCLEDEEDVERKQRSIGVKCICPKTEAPVCGSDNVTYYNRCYLHCRAQQAEMSYHRYKITLKKFGRC